MSSKSNLAKTKPQAPEPRLRLRLVQPDERATKSSGQRTLERPSSRDPLEEPTVSHCGLCGNRIEGQVVSEQRTSGRNLRSQVWHYHEVCWKQLERMRRFDSNSCWQTHKQLDIEVRYATGSSKDSASSFVDGLSRFAG